MECALLTEPAAPIAMGSGLVRAAGKAFAAAGERLHLRGVTYGPFAPGPDGSGFPSPAIVRDDFAAMAAAGVNAIRTYTPPPAWLYDHLEDAGLRVQVDVPWPKHVCGLNDRASREEARRFARDAALGGRGRAARFAYAVANEIPADVIRWHGRRRVERFLADLADVVRQTDPDALVTYANYPSTESLETPFVDFHTFNLYLEEPRRFQEYLARLMVLAGSKPLVLGEIGLDAARNGEVKQAESICGQLADAYKLGAAGAFVFSWTDDWFTGGARITDWEFGLVRADRSPRPAYFGVSELFNAPLPPVPVDAPTVSVVICAYNAAATLGECLESLRQLNTPDVEVVVVDDGSRDRTPEVLAAFPEVRVIRQANRGLAVARNVGFRAATGAIIAYTDADCAVDPDWIAHLLHRFEQTGAAAVGGPNLSPDDGPLAACIAAAPGQPHEMLEADGAAEHLPGCNMAFCREALEAIDGFDPRFRTAGDDVDICWRVLDSGRTMAFAPAAVVWHHRRPSPRAFLKQQLGYGDAEGQLHVKHPARFTPLGASKWRGCGPSGARRSVFRGVFGAGLFQCVYASGRAHWLLWPATLEWHLLALIAGLAASLWLGWIGLAVLGVMLGLSLLLAAWQAAHAPLQPRHDSLPARLLVAALHSMQPLARGWARTRRRWRDRYSGAEELPAPAAAYWSAQGVGRHALLHETLRRAEAEGWSLAVDAGWQDWDLEVFGGPLGLARVTTAEENHGGNDRLVRVRIERRTTPFARLLFGAIALGTAVAVPAAPMIAGPIALTIIAVFAVIAIRHANRAARIGGLIADIAFKKGMKPAAA